MSIYIKSIYNCQKKSSTYRLWSKKLLSFGANGSALYAFQKKQQYNRLAREKKRALRDKMSSKKDSEIERNDMSIFNCQKKSSTYLVWNIVLLSVGANGSAMYAYQKAKHYEKLAREKRLALMEKASSKKDSEKSNK